MGGLFFHTPNPPAVGSMIRLLFDLKAGEIRARAIVRDSRPEKGMGVQFVQMAMSDRQRLNQFLAQYSSTRAPEVLAPQGVAAPAAEAPRRKPERGAGATFGTLQWERELSEKLELTRAGTYYQLFGIASDSSNEQIKHGFYALAREFHPDHHMEKTAWTGRLKDLMGAATRAYKTLSNPDKRAAYDAQLASSNVYNLSRSVAAPQKSIEDCFLHATQCLRAGNFVGSVVWLRKCTELAPQDAKYRALLARSLATIPQYRNDAIAQFERAVELDPWNVPVLLQFAELYEVMQLLSKAQPLYATILTLDPFNAKARQHSTQHVKKYDQI
jgi:tetratricopeptide (TPR) repeat protein